MPTRIKSQRPGQARGSALACSVNLNFPGGALTAAVFGDGERPAICELELDLSCGPRQVLFAVDRICACFKSFKNDKNDKNIKNDKNVEVIFYSFLKND
jgi:hypothetical protein